MSKPQQVLGRAGVVACSFSSRSVLGPVGNRQTTLPQNQRCCGFDSHSGYVKEREYVDEDALQRAIWKAIIALRPNAWIFHPLGGPFQKPGIPDLLIVVDGLLIGMEIKHKKPGESLRHARNRTTAQQRKEIAAINAAGGMAGTVTSVAEALDLVHRAFVKHDALYREKEKGHG